MEQSTDSELVELARSGDKSAFGQLIERYTQMVKRIVLGKVSSQEIAHELVQEIFLHAYLSLDSLRDASRFKNWLYGIALNVCRGYLRDSKADPLSLEDRMGGMHYELPNGLALLEDPHTLVEERELQQFLFDAVQSLSLKDREVILLFYYEELSLQEISKALTISIVAVKGRLHRARKQLKQLLLAYMDIQPLPTPIPERKTMIKARINSVRINTQTQQRVVILQDEVGRRVLFIWIPQPEALVIAMVLNKLTPPRPLASQLMVNLLKATHTSVVEVRIESLKDNIFHAVIKLLTSEGEQEIDARPSDALALAAQLDSPIYIAEAIMDGVGLTIPEGKTLRTSTEDEKLRSREFVTEQIHQTFAASPQRVQPLTEEEQESWKKRAIDFLTGEFLTDV
jgi:RNA polymerase sigma factor (sigma-70 family)